MDNKCLYCRFYAGNKFSGRCHRFPPDSQGVFPGVASDDWCGEWKMVAEGRDYSAPGASLVDRVDRLSRVDL